MATAKVSWVSGMNGSYVLHVEPEHECFREFDGVRFSVYREAQNVANAIKRSVANAKTSRTV